MATDAVRWSCARCKVSTGRIDGEPILLPASWVRSGDQVLCLACSRARAGEAAIDSAPAASSRQERVRLRSKALVEFEISRVPEATDRAVALACRTSSAAVAAIRKELERSVAIAPDLDAGGVA